TSLQSFSYVLMMSSGSQPSTYIKSTFLPVTVGQNVTLNCSFVNDIRAKLYWFKQSLDNTQTMASSYFDKKEFLNEFTNNRRFSLDIENGKINLGMTNVQISDSAVYHCICCVAHQIQFLATVHVIVKELNSGLRVDQRESETVEPGGSLSLNCSVQFGTCDGPHGVHWFKQSEESAPGVLYSHSDQCEKTTDNSCVYSLHVRNLSSEQTGTYYCAVAACGKVLFGNGTKVKIKVNENSQNKSQIGPKVTGSDDKTEHYWIFCNILAVTRIYSNSSDSFFADTSKRNTTAKIKVWFTFQIVIMA
uniref:Ig-like domain-containing protein n=1 Tax=Neogobius melanostomus TaxID=47308 RepID=A0A8C6SU40_9GOBI